MRTVNRKVGALLAAAFLSALAGCGGGGNGSRGGPTAAVTREFDFQGGTEGWTAGFADVPASPNPTYELDFAYADLPAALHRPRKALRLTGHNRSDDLFMFVKRRLDGLRPNARYQIRFDIEIASDAPQNSFGAGGSPGSVPLKAGASAREPQAVPDSQGFLRLNIDKGNQAVGGRDMIVLGTVGVPGDQFVYQFKRLDNRSYPFFARADAQGHLWAIVGTDSGFESRTALYYTRIRLVLTPE